MGMQFSIVSKNSLSQFDQDAETYVLIGGIVLQLLTSSIEVVSITGQWY